MTMQIEVADNRRAQKPRRHWGREELKAISDGFEGAWPEEILQWTMETFGSDAAMATGFGPSGVALMHMLSRVDSSATVFYLDTDLLFPETHALKRRLADRLGLTFTRVHSGISLQDQAREEAPDLWRSNPDRCCQIRKVLPLRRFLSTREAWITGIRRDQSPTRGKIGLVHWDAANELVKINPLANWSEERIWQYIEVNDLPYNALHDHGFPSLGCIPCTKPVGDGEDARAGRWKGHDKLECGIHVQDDDPVQDVVQVDDDGQGTVLVQKDIFVLERDPRYRKSA